MRQTAQVPARILAVWTRDLDETDQVGRVNVAREIRSALQAIHGVPVIGNDLSFEGLHLADYPLIFNDKADLVALPQDPDSGAEDLAGAVAVASCYLRREHSPTLFTERWRQVVLGTDR